MRGLVLSHPAVAAVLRPCLVTWWEGPDDRIPAAVRELERYAPPYERRGNVTAFVVAPDGQVVLGTAPHPGRLPFEGDPGPWFAEEVRAALAKIEYTPPRDPPGGGAGLSRAAGGASASSSTLPAAVRTFIRITDDKNVHAPLVEVTPMTAAAWSALAWPAAPRSVDAAVVAPWLASVYPPAMMDQESRVSRIAGQLKLAADPAPGARRAVLNGDVVVTLPAASAFRGRFYDARRAPRDLDISLHVEVALTYAAHGNLPVDIAGVVRGRYARPGPRQQAPPSLEAVVEAAR